VARARRKRSGPLKKTLLKTVSVLGCCKWDFRGTGCENRNVGEQARGEGSGYGQIIAIRWARNLEGSTGTAEISHYWGKKRNRHHREKTFK